MKGLSALRLGLFALALLVKCAVLQAEGSEKIGKERTMEVEEMLARTGDVIDAEGKTICGLTAYDTWLAAGGRRYRVNREQYMNMIRLANECDMSKYLDQVLEESEKSVDPESLATLKDFMDQKFFDDYLAFREEQKFPFKLTMGPPISEDLFDDPESPFQVKLQEVLEKQLGKLRDEHVRDPNKVTKYTILREVSEIARKIFYAPCYRYRTGLRSTRGFRDFEGAVRRFVINEDDFFKRQSDTLRLAVFRYYWCTSGDYEHLLKEDSLINDMMRHTSEISTQEDLENR